MTVIGITSKVDTSSSPDFFDVRSAFTSSVSLDSTSVESVMMTTGMFSPGAAACSDPVVSATGVEGAPTSETWGVRGETFASNTAEATCLFDTVNRMKGTRRLEGDVTMSEAQFSIVTRPS